MIGFLIRIFSLNVLLLVLDRLLSDGILNKEKSHSDTNRRNNHPRREDGNGSILKRPQRSATASVQSANKQDEVTSEIEKTIAKWTKRLAVFTGALAFFTLVAAGASIYQSIILSRQLGEMQNASTDMKSSIEATNRLGDAAARANVEAHRLVDEAKRSADNAIETTERGLRAYVGVVGDVTMKCPLCNTADIDKTVEITREHLIDNEIILNIENGGPTPAYEVFIEDSYWWGNFGQRLPADFTYPIIPPAPLPFYYPFSSTGTLNPRETVPGETVIDGTIIRLIIRARRHLSSLFYYGNVRYRDIFNKKRTTPFCYEYLPDYPDTDQFANCPEHNNPKHNE